MKGMYDTLTDRCLDHDLLQRTVRTGKPVDTVKWVTQFTLFQKARTRAISKPSCLLLFDTMITIRLKLVGVGCPFPTPIHLGLYQALI